MNIGPFVFVVSSSISKTLNVLSAGRENDRKITHFLLFLLAPVSLKPLANGEWIVIYLEFGNLFVLVGNRQSLRRTDTS